MNERMKSVRGVGWMAWEDVGGEEGPTKHSLLEGGRGLAKKVIERSE